jgi:uncharacterized membrane protein
MSVRAEARGDGDALTAGRPPRHWGDRAANACWRYFRFILLPAAGPVLISATLLEQSDASAQAAAAVLVPFPSHFWHWFRLGLLTADGLWHAGAYLGLFILFGRTLLYNREALITRLARRIHGDLPPDITAYTRRVTATWCCLFLAQPVVSAILAVMAPAAVWSFFVNVLSWLLVGLMFACEYGYRRYCFPDHRSATILEMIRSFRERNDRLSAR